MAEVTSQDGGPGEFIDGADKRPGSAAETLTNLFADLEVISTWSITDQIALMRQLVGKLRVGATEQAALVITGIRDGAGKVDIDGIREGTKRVVKAPFRHPRASLSITVPLLFLMSWAMLATAQGERDYGKAVEYAIVRILEVRNSTPTPLKEFDPSVGDDNNEALAIVERVLEDLEDVALEGGLIGAVFAIPRWIAKRKKEREEGVTPLRNDAKIVYLVEAPRDSVLARLTDTENKRKVYPIAANRRAVDHVGDNFSGSVFYVNLDLDGDGENYGTSENLENIDIDEANITKVRMPDGSVKKYLFVVAAGLSPAGYLSDTKTPEGRGVSLHNLRLMTEILLQRLAKKKITDVTPVPILIAEGGMQVRDRGTLSGLTTLSHEVRSGHMLAGILSPRETIITALRSELQLKAEDDSVIEYTVYCKDEGFHELAQLIESAPYKPTDKHRFKFVEFSKRNPNTKVLVYSPNGKSTAYNGRNLLAEIYDVDGKINSGNIFLLSSDSEIPLREVPHDGLRVNGSGGNERRDRHVAEAFPLLKRVCLADILAGEITKIQEELAGGISPEEIFRSHAL